MPTHKTWRKAVADIKRLLRGATNQQQKLARRIGIRSVKGLPELVAGALLQIALCGELAVPANIPVSAGQIEFLDDLDPMRAKRKRIITDHREAGAWIQFHLLKKRCEALKRLQLEAGDIVRISYSAGNRSEEVASIGGDGRVYLKGGGGACAWPDKLTIQCRRGERGKRSEALRETAANKAAERSKRFTWSRAKELELEDYKVTEALNLNDIEELKEVIDAASDEAPIQEFLETRPRILAALLTGRSRFSVPRPKFGSELIPDFLLGDIDSLGVRWILVELEAPTSAVTLKNDNILEQHARKGVSQVEEWREWIQDNLAKARRPRREGGLGLIDIRPHAEGLVLVGRRERLLDNAQSVRNIVREGNDIRIHTYDWLIENLRGVLSFSGPTGINPQLMYPFRETETE